MSFNSRINWKDRVVERPNTYTETTNADGSVTHTPKPGTVYQEGVPQSATNFNFDEEALQHTATAFDFLLMTYQAEMRDAQNRIETLEAQVAALQG